MSILINNLCHIYNKGNINEKMALHDINLKIEDGEFIGLIGHSGSGKSTLIRHLNGLLRPTYGEIYFNGKDINDKSFSKKELRSQVGLVFQYPEHQLFETTVERDVQYGPKNLGMCDLDVQMNAYKALAAVEIDEDYLDVSPLELSGGQKRRVAIAGILAMQPAVLILDEPTAGLDPVGREKILALIKKIHDENNITVIIVSHSMEDMASYVDRLVVMNKGTIAYDGSCEEVFSHYRELEKIGLRAPAVTYVVEEFAKRGIMLEHNAITVDQAVDAICKKFQ